jgi:hypothetical protein
MFFGQLLRSEGTLYLVSLPTTSQAHSYVILQQQKTLHSQGQAAHQKSIHDAA